MKFQKIVPLFIFLILEGTNHFTNPKENTIFTIKTIKPLSHLLLISTMTPNITDCTSKIT